MNHYLYNNHLEGDPFLWQAGETGVLMMHGFTATPAEMRPLAKNLLAEGFTVGGPMLAGHGTHPADLNRVHWEDWAASGEEMYRQLKQRCQRVFLSGASMGGLTALWLAIQHPEAAGVIGFAPGLKITTPQWKIPVLHLAAPFIQEMGRESFDNPERWQGYPGLPLKGAIQLFEFQKVVRAQLQRIKQPILILQGRRDRTVPAETGDLILNGVCSTQKEHHWMERSTHEITLDEELPEVTRLVVDFIRRCEGL